MKRKSERKNSSVKSYSIPMNDLDTFDSFEEIAETNGITVSELIVACIKEKVHKVEYLDNQMKIDSFEKGLESQIPSLVGGNDEDWEKFYESIKSHDDYKKIDSNLMLVLKYHNEKVKDF